MKIKRLALLLIIMVMTLFGFSVTSWAEGTVDGYWSFNCSKCGYYCGYENRNVPESNWSTKPNPGTGSGQNGRVLNHYMICPNCGYKLLMCCHERMMYNEQKGLPSYEYLEWTSGTCTTSSYRKMKCTDCGVITNMSMGVTGHIYKCIGYEYGSSEHILNCERCGAVKNETHSFNVVRDRYDTSNHLVKCICGAEKLESHRFNTQNHCYDCNYQAHVHTPGDWICDSPATCTEKGQFHKNCTECGEVCSYGSTSALGHNMSNNRCTRCGYTSGCVHEISDWICDWAADCINEGVWHKECIKCGEIMCNGSTDALGHSWSGFGHFSRYAHAKRCSRCGAIGEIQNHTYNGYTRVWNTENMYACANGHTSTTQESSCSHMVTTGGAMGMCGLPMYPYHKAVEGCAPKCTVCNWGDSFNVISHKANWVSTGSYYHKGVCQNCGVEITKNHRMQGVYCLDCGYCSCSHNYVFTQIKAPTCEGYGLGYDVCSKCGDNSGSVGQIAPLGHDYHGTYQVNKQPTCTGRGLSSTKCTRCDSWASGTIAPLGHNSGGWKRALNPTCTAKGRDERFCTRCSVLTESRDVAALGHDPADWTRIKNPTCTQKGTDQRFCRRCNVSTHSRDVAALGHNYQWKYYSYDGVANAYQQQTCTRCNALTGEKKWTMWTVTVRSIDVDTNQVVRTQTTQGKVNDIVSTSATDSNDFTGTNGIEYYTLRHNTIKVRGNCTVDKIVRKKYLFVNFYVNSNDNVRGSMAQQKILHDSGTKLRANAFSRTGYSFGGWSKSPTGAVVYANQAAPTEVGTINLYVKWNPNPYQVSFDGRYVANPATKTIYYDSKYGTLPTLSKTGYDFVGWKKSDGTRIYSTTVLRTASNHTLQSIWSERQRKVTYVAPNKTQTVVVLEGNKTSPPFAVEVNGLKFKHWSTSQNGAAFNFNTAIMNNTTLYAVTEPITVTITVGSQKITRKYGEVIGSLPTASQTGMKFKGWAYDKDGKNMVKSTDKTPYYNLTLYPIYDKEVYTITMPSGTKYNISYKDPIPQLPTPTKKGHTFVNYTAEDGRVVTSGMPYTWTTGITLKENWRVNKVYVVMPDGSTVEYNEGSKLGTITPVVPPSGKELVGYIDQYKNTVTPDTVVETNLTIKCVYENKRIKLTFVDDDWSSTMTVDATVKIYDMPVRAKNGYKFNGWSTTRNGGVSKGPFYADTTLYAKYTAEKQTIYIPYLNLTLTKSTGSVIGTLPTPTSPDGKHFDHWEFNGAKVTSSTRVPAGGMTLEPVWYGDNSGNGGTTNPGGDSGTTVNPGGNGGNGGNENPNPDDKDNPDFKDIEDAIKDTQDDADKKDWLDLLRDKDKELADFIQNHMDKVTPEIIEMVKDYINGGSTTREDILSMFEDPLKKKDPDLYDKIQELDPDDRDKLKDKVDDYINGGSTTRDDILDEINKIKTDNIIDKLKELGEKYPELKDDIDELIKVLEVTKPDDKLVNELEKLVEEIENGEIDKAKEHIKEIIKDILEKETGRDVSDIVDKGSKEDLDKLIEEIKKGDKDSINDLIDKLKDKYTNLWKLVEELRDLIDKLKSIDAELAGKVENYLDEVVKLIESGTLTDTDKINLSRELEEVIRIVKDFINNNATKEEVEDYIDNIDLTRLKVKLEQLKQVAGDDTDANNLIAKVEGLIAEGGLTSRQISSLIDEIDRMIARLKDGRNDLIEKIKDLLDIIGDEDLKDKVTDLIDNNDLTKEELEDIIKKLEEIVAGGDKGELEDLLDEINRKHSSVEEIKKLLDELESLDTEDKYADLIKNIRDLLDDNVLTDDELVELENVLRDLIESIKAGDGTEDDKKDKVEEVVDRIDDNHTSMEELKKLIDELDKIGKELGNDEVLKLVEDLRKLVDENRLTQAEVDELCKELEKLISDLKQSKPEVKDDIEDIKDTIDKIDDNHASEYELKRILDELEKIADETGNEELKKLVEDIRDLLNENKLTDEEIKQLVDELKKLLEEIKKDLPIDDHIKDIEDIVDRIDDKHTSIEELEKLLDKLYKLADEKGRDDVKDLVDEIRNLIKDNELTDAEIEQLVKELEKLIEELEALPDGSDIVDNHVPAIKDIVDSIDNNHTSLDEIKSLLDEIEKLAEEQGNDEVKKLVEDIRDLIENNDLTQEEIDELCKELEKLKDMLENKEDTSKEVDHIKDIVDKDDNNHTSLKELENLLDKLDKIADETGNEELKKLVEDIRDLIKDNELTDKEIEELVKELEKLLDELTKGEDSSGHIKDIEDKVDEIDDNHTSLDELKNLLDKLEEIGDEEVKKLVEDIRELIENNKLTDNEIEELVKELEKLLDELLNGEDTGKHVDKIEDIVDRIDDNHYSTEELEKLLDKLEELAEKTGNEKAKEVVDAIRDLIKKNDLTPTEIEELIKEVKKLIEELENYTPEDKEKVDDHADDILDKVDIIQSNHTSVSELLKLLDELEGLANKLNNEEVKKLVEDIRELIADNDLTEKEVKTLTQEVKKLIDELKKLLVDDSDENKKVVDDHVDHIKDKVDEIDNNHTSLNELKKLLDKVEELAEKTGNEEAKKVVESIRELINSTELTQKEIDDLCKELEKLLDELEELVKDNSDENKKVVDDHSKDIQDIVDSIDKKNEALDELKKLLNEVEALADEKGREDIKELVDDIHKLIEDNDLTVEEIHKLIEELKKLIEELKNLTDENKPVVDDHVDKIKDIVDEIDNNHTSLEELEKLLDELEKIGDGEIKKLVEEIRELIKNNELTNEEIKKLVDELEKLLDEIKDKKDTTDHVEDIRDIVDEIDDNHSSREELDNLRDKLNDLGGYDDIVDKLDELLKQKDLTDSEIDDLCKEIKDLIDKIEDKSPDVGTQADRVRDLIESLLDCGNLDDVIKLVDRLEQLTNELDACAGDKYFEVVNKLRDYIEDVRDLLKNNDLTPEELRDLASTLKDMIDELEHLITEITMTLPDIKDVDTSDLEDKIDDAKKQVDDLDDKHTSRKELEDLIDKLEPGELKDTLKDLLDKGELTDEDIKKLVDVIEDFIDGKKDESDVYDVIDDIKAIALLKKLLKDLGGLVDELDYLKVDGTESIIESTRELIDSVTELINTNNLRKEKAEALIERVQDLIVKFTDLINKLKNHTSTDKPNGGGTGTGKPDVGKPDDSDNKPSGGNTGDSTVGGDNGNNGAGSSDWNHGGGSGDGNNPDDDEFSDEIEIRFWSDGVRINTIDLYKDEILFDPGAPALGRVETRKFLCWTLEDGTQFNFGRPISTDLDLYAKWTR